jgi:pyruvate/2-oxoacid:ferredoxin oxidoreductase beta subunit
VPVNQNVVISGTVTFNGGSQAYTLTGTQVSPAPTGTPSTFINAGTYTYPTNITTLHLLLLVLGIH